MKFCVSPGICEVCSDPRALEKQVSRFGLPKVVTSDRFFYPHHIPMIDTFSCIPFDLPHLIFKEELAMK